MAAALWTVAVFVGVVVLMRVSFLCPLASGTGAGPLNDTHRVLWMFPPIRPRRGELPHAGSGLIRNGQPGMEMRGIPRPCHSKTEARTTSLEMSSGEADASDAGGRRGRRDAGDAQGSRVYVELVMGLSCAVSLGAQRQILNVHRHIRLELAPCPTCNTSLTATA